MPPDHPADNIDTLVHHLKGQGFRVFRRPGSSWCIYSDESGHRLGYAQVGPNGASISTVHRPSPRVGTGFHLGAPPAWDRATLETAFAAAPAWALASDRDLVVKWRDLETYRNQSQFHRELTEI